MPCEACSVPCVVAVRLRALWSGRAQHAVAMGHPQRPRQSLAAVWEWVRERDQAGRLNLGGGPRGCRCHYHSIRPRLGVPSRVNVTQIRHPCLLAIWRGSHVIQVSHDSRTCSCRCDSRL